MGCKKCDKEKTLDRGLGDTLSRAIHGFTGITPCEGCKKRQETLNTWIPYKKKKPWKGKTKLRIRDRIRVNLIRWVRGIAFKTLISMERKLARYIIAIRNRNIKKANSGKLDPKSIQKDRQERYQRRMHGDEVRRAFMSGWIKATQYGKNLEKNKQELNEIL